MKQDRKEAEKLEELLAQTEDHPMMKAILAEKAAANLALRTDAAGKIEALEKERDEAVLKLWTERDSREMKFKKAKVALQEASDEFQAAHLVLSSENNNFDRAIRTHEEQPPIRK